MIRVGLHSQNCFSSQEIYLASELEYPGLVLTELKIEPQQNQTIYQVSKQNLIVHPPSKFQFLLSVYQKLPSIELSEGRLLQLLI